MKKKKKITDNEVLVLKELQKPLSIHFDWHMDIYSKVLFT